MSTLTKKLSFVSGSSSASLVGSPARGAAEKDAGTKEVKRGTGVLLTDHMIRKIARMCECYQVEVMYAEDAIAKLYETLERIRNSPRRYSWVYRTRIERDGDGLKYMIRQVEEHKQRVLRDDRQDDDVSHGLGSSARRAAE